MTCELCGGELVIGSWPFCKDGHAPAVANVIDDTIDEWNEMVAHEPVHYTSRTERRKDLDRRGLVEFVRHVGKPGSDKSDRTSRWV